MLRRSFLKRAALAAIASAFLDVPVPSDGFTATEALENLDDWKKDWDPRLEVMRYQHVNYGVGFVITKELMEDDVYAVDHYKELITRFRMQPPSFDAVV